MTSGLLEVVSPEYFIWSVAGPHLGGHASLFHSPLHYHHYFEVVSAEVALRVAVERGALVDLVTQYYRRYDHHSVET